CRGLQAGGGHERSRGDRPRSELDEAAGRQVSQRTQRVAYVRVSSAGQHLDRQLEAVGPADKTYREYQSAATASERPQLREALDYVREGDTLVVSSIDRLARSLRDMLEIMEELELKGVTVEVVSQALPGRTGATSPRASSCTSSRPSRSPSARCSVSDRPRGSPSRSMSPVSTEVEHASCLSSRSRSYAPARSTACPKPNSHVTTGSAGQRCISTWPIRSH